MTPEKGREVVARYRSVLQDIPKDPAPNDKSPSSRDAMSHLHGMLDKMDGFLDEIAEINVPEFDDGSDRSWYKAARAGEIWDKFNRWLGFMQGAFWTDGCYTLDQMRDHNT